MQLICSGRGNRSRLHGCAIVMLGAAGLAHAGLAWSGLGTAIEYYNPSLRHYFVTAYPEEATALDAGTNVKGWKRTGGQFTVFTDPAPGLQPVCRFFGTPGVGPNSHFYTADEAECAKVKTLPAWTYEAIAFYIPTSANGECGGNWPVYRSYYTDGIADANHRFTLDLTAHVRMPQRRGDVLEGVVMCAPVTQEEREADVVRLLEQATFGPTEALVKEVMAKGIANWIDEQIPLNVTPYTQYPYFHPPFEDCVDDDTLPLTPEKYCRTNGMSPQPVAWEFFRQSKYAPDQLRMRMAHAWHLLYSMRFEIKYAVPEFQQRLRDHAFGTYENLLAKFVLSPQLGNFQNWVNNLPERDGVKPNENFARELMQLFTIGTNELNDDGTPRLDSQGMLIPTYGPADIATMARVLTGFTFPPQPGKSSHWNNGWYFTGDMIPFDAPQYHDAGAKSMLNGRLVLPPGGTAMGDVRAALKALVDHPNTPAFISKQLIQKTVTSSPTPGYVLRIASVFKNNGHGVRGDLAAVTRAILLDPEARGARKIDPEYGRMREPVLMWTSMIRALDVTTDGYQPYWQTEGQILFRPPSIFGDFPADYTLPFPEVPAPEFGIFTSSGYLQRANQINNLLFNVDLSWTTSNPRFGWQPLAFVPNSVGTLSPPLSAFVADAADPEALVERLNRLFLHGTMRADMRRTIVTAVSKVDPGNGMRRAKLAIDLVLTSVAYQVQK